VENEENKLPNPDPKRMMINMTKEIIHVSKRKSRMSSLRYSLRSYKRRLNRTYRMNSKNIKTSQIKNMRRHRSK
jgi:hypothetical protein